METSSIDGSTGRHHRDKRQFSIWSWLRDQIVYIVFCVLVVFNLAVTPGFANVFALRALLFDAAPLILIALGQSLAIGTRGIDLSVGSVMALASIVVALTAGHGQLTGIMLALVAATAVGLFNGSMITVLRINPLISSLALLVAVRGLAEVLVNGARVNLPATGLLEVLGGLSILFIPLVAVVALSVAILMAVAIRKTSFGRYVLFIGSNEVAAFLAGTPVRRTLLIVYALGGLLAGLAGVFAGAHLGAGDSNYIGYNFELYAIAAAVIGGTPLRGGRISVMGSVVGALLLEVLDATFIMNNLDFTYAQIIKAAFIVAALYLQRSEG